MRFRADIQGLRAIAVLLVIFAHVGIPGFDRGWIGVDVYFVISGFLITGLLSNEYGVTKNVSFTQFYLRRAKRILPASIVTILVVVLASEEQFYLLWPGLFLLAARQRGTVLRRTRITANKRMFAVAGSISALSLLWSISSTSSNPSSAYFSTLTRLWELGFGVLLSVLTPRLAAELDKLLPEKRDRIRAAASWRGLALILLGACVIIKPGDPFPGWLALLPVLGAVGLIFGGQGDAQPLPNRLLALRPLPFIGLISFSLYLWHWPIHVFGDALYPDSVNTAMGKAIQIAVIAAFSLVSYRFIERPARASRFGIREPIMKLDSDPPRFPRSAIAAACIGAVFLFTVANAAGDRGDLYEAGPGTRADISGGPSSSVPSTPGTPAIIMLAENSRWVINDSRKQEWVDGLNVTIREFEALSPDTKIVIFGEVPRAGPLESCLSGTSIARCSINPEASRWLRDQQRTVAGGHPNVSFIDSEQLLCASTSCPAVIDDIPVYSDTNTSRRSSLNVSGRSSGSTWGSEPQETQYSTADSSRHRAIGQSPRPARCAISLKLWTTPPRGVVPIRVIDAGATQSRQATRSSTPSAQQVAALIGDTCVTMTVVRSAAEPSATRSSRAERTRMPSSRMDSPFGGAKSRSVRHRSQVSERISPSGRPS